MMPRGVSSTHVDVTTARQSCSRSAGSDLAALELLCTFTGRM
jgi:hypothetical protein